MSKSMTKLIIKAIAVIFIIMYAVNLRERILTDSKLFAAFGQLLSTIPFAKLIIDALARVMRFSYRIPEVSGVSIIRDFMRLTVMACIQPLVFALCSALFLRLPGGSIDEREGVMGSFGYKLKELLIKVLTAPLVAYGAAYLTSAVTEYVAEKAGTFWTVILGIASGAAVGAVSVIPLLGTVAVGTILLLRLVVDILGKLATTMGVNVCCIWIYIGFISGASDTMVGAIVCLVIWLIIMDIAMKFMTRVITG